MANDERPRWLLLIHALPTRPLYLRARVRRELAGVGAAPLRKSVYVLPHSKEGLESLRSIASGIRTAGAFALVCEASFDDDDSRRAVVAAYNEELRAQYRAWMDDAEAVRGGSGPSAPPRQDRSSRGSRVAVDRLRARLEALIARDRFRAPGAQQATSFLADLESSPSGRRLARHRKADLAGLRWVTRKGILVDRIGCAWVVLRFINPSATFRFVAGRDGAVSRGEIGFDMPGAAITHEEGRCSMESLVRRVQLDDHAVRRIAEIVHDLDLRDDRYTHPETAGFERLLLGTIATIANDDERLARGLPLFDALYAALARGAVPTAAVPMPSPAGRFVPLSRGKPRA